MFNILILTNYLTNTLELHIYTNVLLYIYYKLLYTHVYIVNYYFIYFFYINILYYYFISIFYINNYISLLYINIIYHNMHCIIFHCIYRVMYYNKYGGMSGNSPPLNHARYWGFIQSYTEPSYHKINGCY